MRAGAALLARPALPSLCAALLAGCATCTSASSGRPAATEAAPGFERFDRASRAVVAGRHIADGLGTVTLSAGDTGLQLQIDQGLGFDVFAVARDAFDLPGPDITPAFGGGRPPSALHLRSMSIDTVARRTEAPR